MCLAEEQRSLILRLSDFVHLVLTCSKAKINLVLQMYSG